MLVLPDHSGRWTRLTPERLAHIVEHPEMRGLEGQIALTVAQPELVFQSLTDSRVHLYYRSCPDTIVGDKLLCVAVKLLDRDAFVLTAYLTDSIKRGVRIWPSET